MSFLSCNIRKRMLWFLLILQEVFIDKPLKVEGCSDTPGGGECIDPARCPDHLFFHKCCFLCVVFYSYSTSIFPQFVVFHFSLDISTFAHDSQKSTSQLGDQLHTEFPKILPSQVGQLVVSYPSRWSFSFTLGPLHWYISNIQGTKKYIAVMY